MISNKKTVRYYGIKYFKTDFLCEWYRERDNEANAMTDIQTDRLTDRQTGRQPERERERDLHAPSCNACTVRLFSQSKRERARARE